jgi:predicted alpha/beta hydrolase
MISAPLRFPLSSPRPASSAARASREVNASPDLAALEAAFEHPADGGHPGSSSSASNSRGGEPPAHRLAAADGRLLGARWFEPAHEPARAVAVVNAATGVPQRFYRHFAQWLAARGYAVLTYDYRGIGESRQGPLRADAARMRDWALLDMPAALAEATRRRQAGGAAPRHGIGARRGRAGGSLEGLPGDLPLLLVGHSFGGNAIGLADGFEQADALLGVAAQSGDWRNWPSRHRWLTHAFFHALLPAAAHLLGTAPGWVLGGSGAGLPKGVALDWARWGRRRGYLFTDPDLAAHLQHYQDFRGPAHLWHISDDWTYGPAAAVDALAAQFSAARVERPALDAAALHSGRIGHFGAFRAEPGRRIWPQWLERIESATPALRAAMQR